MPDIDYAAGWDRSRLTVPAPPLKTWLAPVKVPYAPSGGPPKPKLKWLVEERPREPYVDITLVIDGVESDRYWGTVRTSLNGARLLRRIRKEKRLVLARYHLLQKESCNV